MTLAAYRAPCKSTVKVSRYLKMPQTAARGRRRQRKVRGWFVTQRLACPLSATTAGLAIVEQGRRTDAQRGWTRLVSSIPHSIYQRASLWCSGVSRVGLSGKALGWYHCKPNSKVLQMLFVVQVLLYVHRNRRLIKDGSPGRPPRLSHSS